MLDTTRISPVVLELMNILPPGPKAMSTGLSPVDHCGPSAAQTKSSSPSTLIPSLPSLITLSLTTLWPGKRKERQKMTREFSCRKASSPVGSSLFQLPWKLTKASLAYSHGSPPARLISSHAVAFLRVQHSETTPQSAP